MIAIASEADVAEQRLGPIGPWPLSLAGAWSDDQVANPSDGDRDFPRMPDVARTLLLYTEGRVEG